MPLDFPASPITGATYTAPNGTIWVFDGAKWANGVYIGTAYAPVNAPTFTGDARAVTPAAGDADTSVATTAFVASAVAPAFNGVGRNLVHNPLFNVAQRGAGAFTALSTYTLDRWFLNGFLDTASVTRQSFTDGDRTQIGDEAGIYCLQNTFTGNAGAAAYNSIAQNVEDVRRVSGKTVTLSFWARAASGTPKIGINLYQAFGTGGSPSAGNWISPTGQSVTLTTVFVRYTVSLVVPSIAGKTLGTSGNDYSAVVFAFSSGATNNAAYGNIGVQSGTLQLWGVQLEVGSVATPLDYGGSPQQQLAECQRFYQNGYLISTSYPGGVATIAMPVELPVTMRASPTAIITTTTNTNCVSGTVMTTGPGVVVAQTTSSAAGGMWFAGTFTASADL